MSEAKVEGVAADHPLQVGDRGLEVGLHVAEPDRDDRVVEEGEEEQRAERGQRKPARVIAPAALPVGPGPA